MGGATHSKTIQVLPQYVHLQVQYTVAGKTTTQDVYIPPGKYTTDLLRKEISRWLVIPGMDIRWTTDAIVLEAHCDSLKLEGSFRSHPGLKFSQDAPMPNKMLQSGFQIL